MDTDEEIAKWLRGGLFVVFLIITIQLFSLGLIDISNWPGMLKAWGWPQWTSILLLVIGILLQALNAVFQSLLDRRLSNDCVKCKKRIDEELGMQCVNEETPENVADL